MKVKTGWKRSGSKMLGVALLLGWLPGMGIAAQSSSHLSHSAGAAASARQADDAAILALLIATQMKHSSRKPFVVEKEAVHGQYLQDIMRAPLPKSVLRNQEARQAPQDCRQRGRRVTLLPPIAGNRPLLFASSTRINKKTNMDYWTHFYREFPNTQGVISFALPGYAKDGNTALAFMQWRSGGRSGESLYLLLTKDAGQWKIRKTLGGWQN